MKYINPSFSNTSIPYLVMYDADKIFHFDATNKKIIFKKEKINIDQLRKKYKYSLFGSENHKIKNSIDKTIEIIEKNKFLTDQYNIKITITDWNKFVNIINNRILYKDNHWITYTTIEGCLINEQSLPLFKKWILFEIKVNLKPLDNDNINKIINSKINKPINTTAQLLRTCASLLKKNR